MARFTGPVGSGSGGDADIADFIFTNDSENGQSIISLPGDKQMRIEAGADSDLHLTAGDDIYIETTGEGDDIHINAADDVRFSAGNETEQAYFWRMDSEGLFQLPGDGYISNPIDSSGDPSTPFNDTIHLVPDSGLEDDRYLIIDPTSPNHIHIRAGGNINESTADLILGGEKNNVVVSDSSRDVYVNTRPDMVINTYTNLDTENSAAFAVSSSADIQVGYTVNIEGTDYTVTAVEPFAEGVVTVSAGGAIFQGSGSYTFTYNPEYVNLWEFGSDGILYGPDEGGLYIKGIHNPDNNLYVSSADKTVLSGANGEFLNDPSIAANQIATIGDISDAISDSSKAFGSFYSLSDQGPYTANAIQPFTYTDAGTVSNVSLANNSQIVFEKAGTYNIAFSAQLHQTNSSGTINIWLKKNGSNVPASNTKMDITSNNPYYVAAWNLFIDVNANDYIELIWSSTSQHTVVEHEPITGSGATEHPAVPSIILTVNQVA